MYTVKFLCLECICVLHVYTPSTVGYEMYNMHPEMENFKKITNVHTLIMYFMNNIYRSNQKQQQK